MAATSTSRTLPALARRALAVGAVAATAMLALAVPASAHTPTFTAACDEDAKKTVLEVDLKNYAPEQGDKRNSVEVTDGEEVLLPNQKFDEEFKKTWDELDATKAHSFKVVVMAHDDPNGTEGWSKTWEKNVAACVEEEQPPSSEEPPPSSEEEVPPTTTTTTEVPVGANGQLAETGASIAVPLVIGGLLLAGGAVMLILVRRRSKA